MSPVGPSPLKTPSSGFYMDSTFSSGIKEKEKYDKVYPARSFIYVLDKLFRKDPCVIL
jgi:hypothetical protein